MFTYYFISESFSLKESNIFQLDLQHYLKTVKTKIADIREMREVA